MPLASTAIERLIPPFAPIYRASSGLLCSARGLGYAAVHGHLRELQADEAVVGLEADLPESLHQPELDPLVASATQGALRAGCVGDPVVGAAEDEHLHQLLEDDPLGDARAVASQRMVGAALGQQIFELLPDGLDEVRFEGGHGHAPSRSGSVENSPHDGTSRARFSYDFDPY